MSPKWGEAFRQQSFCRLSTRLWKLALALWGGLPGAARAGDWGDTWGSFTWSAASVEVPALTDGGLALVACLLLVAGAVALNWRRKH